MPIVPNLRRVRQPLRHLAAPLPRIVVAHATATATPSMSMPGCGRSLVPGIRRRRVRIAAHRHGRPVTAEIRRRRHNLGVVATSTTDIADIATAETVEIRRGRRVAAELLGGRQRRRARIPRILHTSTAAAAAGLAGLGKGRREEDFGFSFVGTVSGEGEIS